LGDCRPKLVEEVVEFFKQGKLLKNWNATFLVLALKKNTTKEPKDFRPISLCNVTYKIITKILAKRMKHILPALISKEYDGFVTERLILNGIILMHKIMHSLKERKEEAMLIKLDVEKSYDRVN